MPSRLGVLLILAFWLAVTAYVVHRDLLPRLANTAPAVEIDMADEATRGVPARWGVWRGSTRIGTLVTSTQYEEAADTFRFESSIRELNVEAFGTRLRSPMLNLAMRIHRDGTLAGEGMHGTLIGSISGFDFSVEVTIESTVVSGMLEGHCKLASSFLSVDELLTPVPVPAGQVLHPLQPMNRLRNVQPGHRWAIHQVDPLAIAMTVLAKKLAEKYGLGSLAKFHPGGEGTEMIAEVLTEPVMLSCAKETVLCWQIDYRSENAAAHTWVAVSDGKVLRQEAASFGETLRLERED